MLRRLRLILLAFGFAMAFAAVGCDDVDGNIDAGDALDSDADGSGSDGPEVTEETGYSLKESAEVYRDEWGTPHIYAESELDMVFIQGYETARDRLFNIDYLRKTVYGELASAYGEEFLSGDIEKRALNMREIVDENYEFYAENYPEVASVLWAFAHGVNAYMEDAKAGRNGAYRPSEFDRVSDDWWPEEWTAADSLSIAKALILSQSFQPDIEVAIFAASEFLDPDGEVQLGQVRDLTGAEAVVNLLPFTPVHGTYILEESPTPDSELSMDRDAEPILARKDGQDDAVRRILRNTSISDIDPEQFAKALEELASSVARISGKKQLGGLGGSNSWVVDGEHMENGGGLLCNDTHMPVEVPSLLYPTHIVNKSKDEFGSVGYSGPGIPLTLIGNTRNVSWGLTNAFGDVADIYVESVTEDGEAVMRDGERVEIIKREQVFEVRQEDGTIVEETEVLREIPGHGPVLNDLLPASLGGILDAAGFLLSIRWVGFSSQTADMVAFRNFIDAQNVDDQVDALEYFESGVMALVLADKMGDIAFVPAGPSPIRANINEYPPYNVMPGTGEAEWDGFRDYDEIPKMVRPNKGYVVTANGAINDTTLDNTPQNGGFYFQHFHDLGTRAWRITEELERMIDEGPLTFAQMQELQVDTFQDFGPLQIDALLDAETEACEDDDPRLCQAIDVLKDWDYMQPVDSAGAAIFNVWMVNFWLETYKDELPSLFLPLVGDQLDNSAGRAIAHWLNGRPPASGINFFDDDTTEDVEEDAQDMALRALRIAVDELGTYFDDLEGEATEPADWTWGGIHKAQWVHPVFDDLTSEPIADDGGMRTVQQQDWDIYSDGGLTKVPYLSREAAQIRYCVELREDGFEVRSSLSGGAHAHSESEHFDDQRQSWVDNETHALHFAREDVEANAESHVRYLGGFPVDEPTREELSQ